jgi:hypothetical protein
MIERSADIFPQLRPAFDQCQSVRPPGKTAGKLNSPATTGFGSAPSSDGRGRQGAQPAFFRGLDLVRSTTGSQSFLAAIAGRLLRGSHF